MSLAQLVTCHVRQNALEQVLKDVPNVRMGGHMILKLAVKVCDI